MMPPDPSKIEELLSGLLDGSLSEEEQRQIDAAMRENPEIASRFDELSSLRSSLLRGRSTGRLGDGFASRIIEAARERAAALDQPPAWVLPDAPNAVPPKERTDSLKSSEAAPFRGSMTDPEVGRGKGNRKLTVARGLMGDVTQTTDTSRFRFARFVLPVLAVAAGLLALLFWLPKNDSLNRGTRDGFTQNGDNDKRSGDKKSETNDQLAQQDGVGPNIPIANSPSQKLPGSDQNKTPNNSPSLTVPRNAPEILKKGEDMKLADGNANSKTGENKAPIPGVARFSDTLTFIAHVTVDAQAIENDAFGQLLSKYEVIAESDVGLTDEQVDSLVAAGVVKNAKGPGDPANFKTMMYLIKAKASTIDQMLVELESNYSDFPSYSLDLSLEAKVLNLFKALAALSDSEGGNKALKLMWSEGGVDSDKASGLQGAPMNPERPLELRKKALTQKDLMNGVETSYAIIFLRVPR